tara:strand:+ start:63 stop:689 length:627 start_codon:yes stop_codon:yes gene_type:complete
MIIKYDVEELFPTPLIKIKVEENTEQLKLISDCTTSSIDSNGQFLGNMRVLEEHPNIRDLLLSKFSYVAEEYLQYKKRKYIITTSWITKTIKGSRSQLHSHRNSFWSGVYYFQDEYEKGTAELSFSSPNEHQTDVYFDESDIKRYVMSNSNAWVITPMPKLLLLFPSYLQHEILHHNIDTDRRSLAFNIMPTGRWGTSDSTFDTDWIR